MFYYYFRVFNWIYCVFGFIRPYSDGSAKMRAMSHLLKIWTIVVIACNVVLYTLNIHSFSFNLKENLPQISEYNDLIVNTILFVIELVNSNDSLVDLYQTMTNIFENLKITNSNLKWIAIKLYFWFAVTSLTFIMLISMEIVKNDYPLKLVIQLPTFLTIYHLFAHFYLLLSALKVLSNSLPNTLEHVFIKVDNQGTITKASILKYLFSFEKGFIEHNKVGHQFSIRELCLIYDDINVCMKLLENIHGLHILLIIWSMFSSTVFGVTVIACKEVEYPTLVVIKCALPFIWCSLCCLVDDQLHKEVEVIDTIIIKHIIDYNRCDRTRRRILQNFKQLVSTERLDFTACNLFKLNYSMLLGTIVNIITYSIILIQLFVNG